MTTEKRLWHVVLSDSFVVLATDEADAERIAYLNRTSGVYEADHVAEIDHYPVGWDASSVPFGCLGRETIGELVAKGAAPRLVQAQQRLVEAAKRRLERAAAKTEDPDGS